jgi:hypothetical protein
MHAGAPGSDATVSGRQGSLRYHPEFAGLFQEIRFHDLFPS